MDNYLKTHNIYTVIFVSAVNALTGRGFFLTSGLTIHASIVPVRVTKRGRGGVKTEQISGLSLCVIRETVSSAFTVLHSMSFSTTGNTGVFIREPAS